MTQKIKVSRHPDGWHVERPAYGFGSASTTVYSSGAAALASLVGSGLGSASPQIESRSYERFTWTGRWSSSPGWIEASA